jgi:hypothetical protein
MKRFLSLALAVAGFMVVLPAYASLQADGLTYTLTAFATPDPHVDTLTLTISGINGSSDTEGGRYGVFAIAFNDPTGFATITGAPSGFALVPGGLSSGGGGGCNGHGNFVCFENTKPISQSSLPADSTLSFAFTVGLDDYSAAAAAAAADYQDDFKISWDGSKSKNYHYDWQDPTDSGNFKSGYDHVSQNIAIDAPPAAHAAPEIDPASATAALTFLIGGLAVMRGQRRRS